MRDTGQRWRTPSKAVVVSGKREPLLYNVPLWGTSACGQQKVRSD
jgi:hypothetical protein